MPRIHAQHTIPAPRRVLVVGSWAKEQITIEHLRRGGGVEIGAYVDTRNPGILALADRHRIGSLYDVGAVAAFAGEMKADLVLPTTASPLAAGLVDALHHEGIPVFGPTRSAARLECDKAFARRLMARHVPDAIPPFGVFEKAREAVALAEKLDWQVAVKPLGLTEGLGVKVFGDQLRTPEEVAAYVRKVLDEKVGHRPGVIVEEKMRGEEFTIQALVGGGRMVATPPVQDFKKLLPGDRGPNTASMGSFSDSDHLLPFLGREDYEAALDIMRRTTAAFRRETGGDCAGFLYGQFMLTGSGLRLVEYNFRPGDPEWMNTVAVLRTNLVEAVCALMRGEDVAMEFEPQATVCKYIVPEEYPRKLNQVLPVELDEKAIAREGVAVYYSCGRQEDGALNVGTERGIAFLARGERIGDASERIEAALRHVRGRFHHRSDIGTWEMIRAKSALAEAS